MKKLEHDGTCKEVHPDSSHEEWEIDKETVITGEESELEELVDYDGSIIGSKVPLGWENVKTMSATKTLDATVPMSRQSGEQGRGYFFKRYWGESVEELGEHDMTDVLGYDDTIYLDANETIEYFKKEHDMDEDEAEDRTESMGKTKSLDKKTDGEENFQRLVEDDDVLNMLEIILNKKDDSSGIHSDMNLEDSMLDRKIKHLKKYARNKGYSMDELINWIKDE
jgi:hypothetical protein